MINLNATLVIQLVNFLLLMVLLDRLLFRPMLRVLQERQARTEGRRQKAQTLEAEAEAIWSDYQAKIQAAKADADRIRTQLVQQAEAQRQKLLADAEAEAQSQLAKIRAQVQAEAAEARKTLESEARALAQELAERLLERRVA
ncbi:MAG: hypothetical protein D6708_02260 [Candidatus Dadabacteria bacterium]|nr:MAG: hypothetical protein D6708_02260 [Candidatus Dadabacteria bacterium]